MTVTSDLAREHAADASRLLAAIDRLGEQLDELNGEQQLVIVHLVIANALTAIALEFTEPGAEA